MTNTYSPYNSQTLEFQHFPKSNTLERELEIKYKKEMDELKESAGLEITPKEQIKKYQKAH